LLPAAVFEGVVAGRCGDTSRAFAGFSEGAPAGGAGTATANRSAIGDALFDDLGRGPGKQELGCPVPPAVLLRLEGTVRVVLHRPARGVGKGEDDASSLLLLGQVLGTGGVVLAVSYRGPGKDRPDAPVAGRSRSVVLAGETHLRLIDVGIQAVPGCLLRVDGHLLVDTNGAVAVVDVKDGPVAEKRTTRREKR